MEQAVVDDDDVGIEMDRLSELPIEVMQHILSFLPTKQYFNQLYCPPYGDMCGLHSLL